MKSLKKRYQKAAILSYKDRWKPLLKAKNHDELMAIYLTVPFCHMCDVDSNGKGCASCPLYDIKNDCCCEEWEIFCINTDFEEEMAAVKSICKKLKKIAKII